VSVLLRQPHGFEGSGSVRVVVDVDNFAVSQLGVNVEASVNLSSAYLSSGGYVNPNDDAVAFRDHLVSLEAMLVPGFEPLVPVPHGSLDAVQATAVLVDRKPLDFWMEGGSERGGVVLEGPEPTSDHRVLHPHVLLRHRPRSIAQRKVRRLLVGVAGRMIVPTNQTGGHRSNGPAPA